MLISCRRSRPRRDESRVTSARRAFRGGFPASPNQATCTRSPSTSQVPRTTPPTTTTGEIQPLCLLTAVRRDGGTTGRRRSQGRARTDRTPGATARPSWGSQWPARRGPRPVRARAHRQRRPPRAGRRARRTRFGAGASRSSRRPASCRRHRSSSARTRGSTRRSRRPPPRPDRGRPRQRELASSGRMNVTRLPWLGPKQRSPCHARGFRSVPQPERSAFAHVTKPALPADRGGELLSGERSALERRADHAGEASSLCLRRHPEVALPARAFPRPS